MEIPQQTDPLVPIESDPHTVLMMESIIECRLELFFISTTCIFSSDEKGKLACESDPSKLVSFHRIFHFGGSLGFQTCQRYNHHAIGMGVGIFPQ